MILETIPYLLWGTKDKQICSQTGHHPGMYPRISAHHRQEIKTGLIRACCSAWHIVLDSSAGMWGGKKSKRWLSKTKDWAVHHLETYWKERRIGLDCAHTPLLLHLITTPSPHNHWSVHEQRGCLMCVSLCQVPTSRPGLEFGYIISISTIIFCRPAWSSFVNYSFRSL